MTRKTLLSMVSALSLLVAAGAVQAQQATPKAAEAPQDGFAMLDFNGDGKLTAEDFTARKLAQQKALDADGDGFITLEEMKAHAGEEARKRAEARAERRFLALDTDGDGRLSAAEALMAGPGRPGHGPEAMLRRADTDGDGAVSPEEFAAARKMMRERHAGRHGGEGKARRGWGQGHGKGPQPGAHPGAPEAAPPAQN